MKRIFLIAGGIMALNVSASAQLNMAALQDAHNAPNAALHLPQYLGDGYNSVSVGVFNTYGSIGSNFATTKDVRDYIKADQFTNEMIGNSIGKLKKNTNNINAAVDVSILNVGINVIKHDGKPVFSIGFGVDERVEMNTTFNRTLFLLAYQGNKQFAGQTINIAPRLNGLAYTDYWVSGALTFTIPNTNISIKPAARLRYLSGQASINMPKSSNITMYTEPDGRYLDFGFNYNVNTSTKGDTISFASSSFSLDQKSFQQGAGSGFGVDLGVRIMPMEDFSIDLGIMDIGGLKFKNHAVNMYNYSTYRYEGQEITFEENQRISLDSLNSIVKPNYTYNSYSVKLPTKLSLTGTLGVEKVQKRGYSYYKHQITFAYLQGFDNYLSSTTTPWFAIGYTRSFHNVLNLGANIGAGGLWGVSVGALASLKVGAFRIGFSSTNLLPLIAPKSGRGTDGALMLGLAF